MTYSGLSAIILVKDMITEPNMLIGLLAPIVGLWTYDKIQSHVNHKHAKGK
tara:strand:+ start:179 stop:331 length:153 start_codon:yes stop_codon:yes gene_type:complete